MELEGTPLIVITIISIGLVLGVGLFILGTFQTTVFTNSTDTSATQTILSESTATLTPIDTGITSSEVKANNQTWLNFTTDDYLLINSDITESISFWYKNETSDWFFVANSSGTLYTDASAGSPTQFPVHYNGTDYFLGKTDGSTFFNGSIDDFRIYNSTLDTELISLIYAEGRL